MCGLSLCARSAECASYKASANIGRGRAVINGSSWVCAHVLPGFGMGRFLVGVLKGITSMEKNNEQVAIKSEQNAEFKSRKGESELNSDHIFTGKKTNNLRKPFP